VPLNNGLESLLASRYLRLIKSRRVTVYLPPALAFGLWVALNRAAYHHGGAASSSAPRWIADSWLLVGQVAAVVATVLLAFLSAILRRFTIFSSISTFGLYLGSTALVVVLSVMSGFEQDLKQKILGANAHVLITSPEQPFTDYAHVVDVVGRVPGVDSVMPYLGNEVMVSSQANLAGVVVKGIDPALAAQVTDLGRNLEQGKLDNLLHPEVLRDLDLPARLRGDDAETDPPADGDAPLPARAKPLPRRAPPAAPAPRGGKPATAEDDAAPIAPAREPRRVLPGIIIGRELAKNLRLFLGDDLNVISPMGDIGPAGPIPKSRPFRVAGIFYSGMYEYDTKNAYVTLAAAQKFLAVGDEVTGLEIRVRDPDATPALCQALRAALGEGAARYEVKDWQELNRNLFSALKVEKVAMFVVLCFVILVAGFSIVANGVMLVSSKAREIAMLKAMGATDRSVLTTFLLVGLRMGGVGIPSGVLTGIGFCLALAHFGWKMDSDVYYIAKLPVQMNPVEIGSIFVAALAIALCATLYPALLAARLRPSEALRSEKG
jgi:lipoprotein-releasing system permease protein